MTAPAPRHARHVRHVRLAAMVDTLAFAALPIVEWFDDHVATPFAQWRADRKGWEKAAAAIQASIQASILLGCLIGAILGLTGCRSNDEIPGHGVEPSAVKIADGLELSPEQMAETLNVNPAGLAVLLNRAGR